eukprot:TRINITY_DN4927_c0_g2_i2.p1 TRINITY_DN4927_c0_g2~~TRINITY_DN4927_c0_g2_i2.p1  ORF type:complete len:419 (-),score=133.73 TRINITY_DN4927_c0_g2_i2:144-1400(-)
MTPKTITLFIFSSEKHFSQFKMNFTFQNTTKIVFGAGEVKQLKDLIPSDHKVYLTYGGGSIKKNGIYDQVIEAIGDKIVKEFPGIPANPEFEHCMKAVEEIKAMEAAGDKVFIVAVGGGSVIDGTKFIAAASRYTHSDDKWEILQTCGKYVEEAVPFGSVLTLPATGSEMNPNSVMSYRAKGEKLFFGCAATYPLFSILEPKSTLTLPLSQTKNGVIDAFVHVCEQYMTFQREDADVQDRYSEALLMVLLDNGRKIMKDESDMPARCNIMWAATQALNFLNCCGVAQDWVTHMIGHEITATLGLDHAQTLACVQPAVFRYKFEKKMGKLAQCSERVFGVTEGSEKEKAEKCIELIEKFYREDMKQMTKISEYISDYTEEKHKEAVDAIIKRFESRDVKFGEHGDILAEDCRNILNMIM